MSELIYGSLKPLANVGQAGIKTSGAYHHASGEKVNHAEQFNKEHAHKALYGKKKPVPGKQTVSIDLDALKYLMKKEKLTRNELRAKTGLASVSFNKAVEGYNIYKMTADKIADALNAETWLLVNR